MNDNVPFYLGLALGFFLGVSVSSFMWMVTHRDYRKEAIELNYAMHNPVTGKWEWIEKGEVAP